MGKIKINLTSGNVIEKPLVTAFKTQMGNYIILDNESNGSMGLPIICVSKFNGTNVEKIVDQNEWAQAKECLKTIIGGTNLEYINVPESISANDDFFTQLTLPLASFDVLKNVYAPVVSQNVASAPALNETPAPAQVTVPTENDSGVAPAVTISPFSAVGPMPAAPAVDASVIPTVEPVAPVAPTDPVGPIVPPVIDVAPIVPEPVVVPENQTVAPVAQTIEAPAAPVVTEPAIVTPAVPVNASINNDYAQMKETFLKSCENMFDALVKEFQNK